VLPILHLNGFKIANPTLLARIGKDELTDLMRGYGYEPYFVEGDNPEAIHQILAATLDIVVADIHTIQRNARALPAGQRPERPHWPMIVLRTSKGWTGPKVVDGKRVPTKGHRSGIATAKSGAHSLQSRSYRRPGSLRPRKACVRVARRGKTGSTGDYLIRRHCDEAASAARLSCWLPWRKE
jgi:xylulose-5-phosphate/fructose-6-phosphate phosphoketolase